MVIYSLPFAIVGPPVAMGRPRFTRTGRVYVPQHTREAVEQIADAAQSIIKEPIEGAISLKVTFVHARPGRLNRKKDPAERMAKTTKPDLDNLIKTVMDGLTQGNAWHDDNQVCRIYAEDYYAAKGEDPKTIIQLGVFK